MATPASHGAAAPTAQELRIDICRDFYVLYTGTPEQLQAEGLIPPGTSWPTGRAAVHWKAGRLEFVLRASKQSGCWVVHMDVPDHGASWWNQRRVERLEQELAYVQYLRTPQGAAAFNRDLEQYFAARRDTAFQSFKAQVLPQRTRGRRKTTNTQGA